MPGSVPVARWPHLSVRLLKNAVLHVPGVAGLDMQRHARRTGPMYNSAHVLGILRVHFECLQREGVSPSGMRVLELGPGNSLGDAFVLCLYGTERVTAVDVRRYATEKVSGEVYRSLIDRLEHRSDPADKLPTLPSSWRDTAQRLLPPGSVCPRLDDRLRYEIVPGSDLPVEDASVDFAYSTSVLEHVPDPARTYAELARALRPGGLMSHIIDLSDHHSSEPFDFLRYGDRLWRLMQSRSAGFTNRLRESEHLRLMREAGFSILNIRRKQADAPPRPQDVHPRFRVYEGDDLRTLSIVVSARRVPAGAAGG